MDERKINPALKQALELGPPLLFFAGYILIKDRVFVLGGTEYDGFIVAAAAFVPVILASIGALWWLTGRISRMQVFTAVMVILFGGLTVWFNDERFFKLKTTIVYALLAGLLGLGLLMGRSWLQWAMGELLPMRDAGWAILTRRLMLAFAAMALANEVVWRTQSTEVWVAFETFALPVALFVFLAWQIAALRPYFDEDEAP